MTLDNRIASGSFSTGTGAGTTSPDPRWRQIGHRRCKKLSLNPQLATATAYPIDDRVPSYDCLDLVVGFDVGRHADLRRGINNLLDKQPPVVGFSLNPLLVNGNMLAPMYDPFCRSLLLALTAKY